MKHDAILVRVAALAEWYCFEDPNISLFMCRQFIELLPKDAAAKVGLYAAGDDNLVDLLRSLRDRGALPREIDELFHRVRKTGNAAAHSNTGTQRDALEVLKWARHLAIWFHRSLGGARGFKAGPFVTTRPDRSCAGRA